MSSRLKRRSAIVLLVVVGLIWVRLFTFRFVGADDPTVYLAVRTTPGLAYELRGREHPRVQVPQLVVASGENGFPLEGVYLSYMASAWWIVGGLLCVAALALRRESRG